MAGVNGIEDFIAIRFFFIVALVIVANSLVELAECHPVSVAGALVLTIVCTAVAVQLIVRVVVIQGSAYVFRGRVSNKVTLANFYNILLITVRAFALFGITRGGVFWSPVAATRSLVIYCIVIRIRIEALFRIPIVFRDGFPFCTVAAVCKVTIATQRIRREYNLGIAIRHICCIVICALNPAHCAVFASFALFPYAVVNRTLTVFGD